jgi:hypothetical protein
VQTFLQNMDLAARPEIDAAIAVAQLSRRELLGIPNFGVGACAAVVAWLSRHGLKLQQAKSPHAYSQRLIYKRSSEQGAPARRRPSVFNNGPFAADRTSNEQAPCVYRPPTT